MKKFANKGIARNKKPLKNLIFEIEISKLKESVDITKYEKYKFKELGYITLTWYYESINPIKNWSGFVTPEHLKELFGIVQYAKFCQGKREFVIQRRVDGKNIPK